MPREEGATELLAIGNSHFEAIAGFQLGRVYESDAITALRKMPRDSVDVLIADPPYNLSKGGSWSYDSSAGLPGMGGDWRKTMEEWDSLTLKEYFSFTMKWLSLAKKVVKPTGSMWVMGTYHNIGIVNVVMQLLNIEIINEIIWYKRNAFPNISCRRLTASHETILWAHTGTRRRRYFFNYDWAKSCSFSFDRLKRPGRQMRTVWDIPSNKSREELVHGSHPTQKPSRLIERMINLSSKPNDIVLSLFCGSGADCVVAKRLGRRFLGFEVEARYVDLANRRIQSTYGGFFND